MKKSLIALVSAVVILAFGCGEPTKTTVKVDETTPIPQVKAEAGKMDQAQLQQKVDAYRQSLIGKKAEMTKLQNKLKEIPIAEMLGDKAKKLKGGLATQTKSITALQQRLQVYIDALNKKK